jgi:hypothetical protein
MVLDVGSRVAQGEWNMDGVGREGTYAQGALGHVDLGQQVQSVGSCL